MEKSPHAPKSRPSTGQHPHPHALDMTHEMSMIPAPHLADDVSDDSNRSEDYSLNEFIEELAEEIYQSESKSHSQSRVSQAKSRSRYLEEERKRDRDRSSKRGSTSTLKKRMTPASKKDGSRKFPDQEGSEMSESDSDRLDSGDPRKGRPSMGANFQTEHLNVLIVGEARSGKTELIKKFLNYKGKKTATPTEVEPGFVEHTAEFFGKGGRRILSLIHMKGYSSKQPIKTWYNSLKTFLCRRLENHHQKAKAMGANKDAVIDERIHFCLFMFKAPKPRFNEIICMKKLHKLTLVVPVEIGKREEVKAGAEQVRLMKRTVLAEFAECDVETFNFHENHLFLKKMVKNFLGGCPLVFLCEGGKEDDLEEDDFLILSSLLSRVPAQVFLAKIESRMTERATKVNEKLSSKKQQTNSDLKQGIGFGMAVGIGLLGAVVALRNKIV